MMHFFHLQEKKPEDVVTKYRAICMRLLSSVRHRPLGLLTLTALLVASCMGGLQSKAQAALPLQTRGPYIVDSNGSRVRLNAFNWYGAESPDYVVAGLQVASLQSIVRKAKDLGFNTVRLPWSNQLYESNPIVANSALAANPGMQGEKALTVLDQVIDALSNAGIMVILDNHNSNAEWCCGDDGNDLWYNKQYPETSWISDWKGITRRYRNNPYVVGADLRNEPRIAATWGGSPTTDWHAAAQRGGNAVLSANPKLLVFVEGVDYALDLSGVAKNPISLSVSNRLVYEAHDYAFDHSGMAGYNDYVAHITAKWGYLVTGANPQPVWIGEFGTCNSKNSCVNSDDASNLGYWFGFLTTYLQQHQLDWAYWAINGTQSSGVKRVYGAAEEYGLLNTAWSDSSLPSLTLRLQELMTSGEGKPSIKNARLNLWKLHASTNPGWPLHAP